MGPAFSNHSSPAICHTLRVFQQLAVWAKQYLNSFIAWCNYIELGCPDCRVSEWVPLGTLYQPGTLARTFTDRLLDEVVEFGSLDLIFGQLQCQGGRRAVEEIFLMMAWLAILFQHWSALVIFGAGFMCTIRTAF